MFAARVFDADFYTSIGNNIAGKLAETWPRLWQK